jgi:hypothetical protein
MNYSIQSPALILCLCRQIHCDIPHNNNWSLVTVKGQVLAMGLAKAMVRGPVMEVGQEQDWIMAPDWVAVRVQERVVVPGVALG